MTIFSRNWNHHWKCREQKKKFSGNVGHIILELCNVLIQIHLATSEPKRDNSSSKIGIRVASRDAERLKA